ncbi:MAG: threonine--tRNA ligase [Candidatus Bathyarchaeota archaeon]|jgi:threonyl-tRNA synthetase
MLLICEENLKWVTQKQTAKKPSSTNLEHPRKTLRKKEILNHGLRKEREELIDHRVLGRELNLFSVDEETGIGLILWHPKGSLIRKIIRDFWEEQHLNSRYQLVSTPHLAREELWKTSGHLDYYAENMYLTRKKGEAYVVKPMNCPFHIQIYKSKHRSYRELPIRFAEWGTVYRYERSGTLHGLLRVRGFTQDDAHIFCTEEQLNKEIPEILDLSEVILRRFGFTKYKVELSTRNPKTPKKYLGSNEEWELAQHVLSEALEQKDIHCKIMEGEAVFYGPKIDIKIVNASGKEWQCSTIQLDFNLPRRFNLAYRGRDGKRHRPLMIHRALLGSIERFLGILIEHYQGNFPVWLAPIQVAVLPISDKYNQYAREVHKKLLASKVRASLDESSSTIRYKIREAETLKIPYMAICGKVEAESNTVSIRRHGIGDLGLFKLQQLNKRIRNENKTLK